jgi:nucleotide-binding universal stress UspA family protein
VLHASIKPLLLVRPGTPESDMQAQLHPVAAQPYRTILVPLDGSAFAEQALAQARDLASLTGASLVLVTVMLGEHDYMSEVVAAEHWAIADRNTAEQLGSYLADTAAQLQAAGLPVSTQLVHGYPPEEILRVGDQVQADLIVMATHGRGGFQRLWLGSVALKIVQASNIPILVIRPTEQSSEAGVL